MSIAEAYNAWSEIYDTNKNRTRDLDQKATIETLSKFDFDKVLELGSGTGKNTTFLLSKASQITCFDFSEGMLEIAKQKLDNDKITFLQADLNEAWNINDDSVDLITSSLVLEHIENLDHIFQQAFSKLNNNGIYFICELHPFKQYSGTKARYETENGIKELEVYLHHFTEYTNTASNNGFDLIEVNEWFDNNDKTQIPRLLSFVFRKILTNIT